MKKIDFVNGTTIDGAKTFNDMQNNVEDVFNGKEPMGSIVVEDIKCRQLFNKNDVAENYYLGYENGTPTWDGNMAYMQSYIEVEPNITYTMCYSTATIFIIHRYDSNKNWLGYLVQNDSNNFYSSSFGDDTKYVRLSCGKTAIDKMMFVKGSVIPDDYIEYKKIGYIETVWKDIIYENTYSSYDETNYNKLQYKKINNQIFLRGMIKNTTIPDGAYFATAGTLPEEARPLKNAYFIANEGDKPITAAVSADGTIKVYNTSVDMWIALDGISFFVD